MDSLTTDRKISPTVGSSLIPIINKLDDTIAPISNEFTKISMPQVVVIGSQSSGKSSVLEALVGRDFLPRGCDICTRRPLVLKLENRPAKNGTEWGEFRHLPGKRFYDFLQIRREIQVETEREAGLNKRVSDKEIHLKIYSPNVLNMILVDLPGMTKIPVGDQPNDIEARIRKMIMAYIRQENCIILAVSPANSDLATSDSLQMAKESDPTGARTIGVITKLDIMDRGTDARNFLLGKVIPLRLGYIGIVNRSQEDINKNRSIVDGFAYEDQFFSDHPVYTGLLDRCGVPQLARKLNQILEHHIQMSLPGLKAELNRQMLAVTKELQRYGKVTESKVGQGAILLTILSEYCEGFFAMMDGNSQEMSIKELSGGARINYIFQSIFVKSLEEVDPCEGLTDDDIQMAIQNASGLKNALFVPEVPFEVLVKGQIARLLDPSIQCVRFVYDEMVKMCRDCEGINLQRFPLVRKRLDEVVGKVLHDGVKPAERMIENLIEIEMGYINCSHPKFLGGNKAVELAMHELNLQQGSMDVEKASIEFLVNGVIPHYRARSSVDEKPVSGNKASSTWGIPSIFRSKASSGETQASKSSCESCDSAPVPSIQLREPPSILRPIEMTEREAVEIIVIKLLLRSYYDIVRKNIQDLVPKAIMHFVVNHAKRELHKTLIQELYSENLFGDLLRVEDEVAVKRKRNQEFLKVLQQAVKLLEEVESDVSTHKSGSKLGTDAYTEYQRSQG